MLLNNGNGGGNHMANAAQMQHDLIGVQGLSNEGVAFNPHPQAAWFKKGGNMGLFIHFGISAVSGKVDLSWGMMANKPWEQKIGVDFTVTPNEYFSFAQSFEPKNYDPEKWILAIKEAGFTYAVFTAKHHDGFAMWPSEYGSFSTKNYLSGFDFVEGYVNACRKHNIKIGLYYSPPDWYYNREYMSFNYGSVHGANAVSFEGRPHYDALHKPTTLKSKPNKFEDAFTEYVDKQIRELITKYGKIDMLWFDGSIDKYEKVISIDEIRKIQPWIIINSRLHHMGDFKTFECKMPKEKPTVVWEYEEIWADGPWWGYMEQSKGYKPAGWLVDAFERTKKWNGNFLINVGPMADGELPQEVYSRLSEVKRIMENRL
ncbi:MAG: alpha-L-fucosidase [Firmicutes bacterium]|nr:alpha-L-fucosidase [Bacillota bacterium]